MALCVFCLLNLFCLFLAFIVNFETINYCVLRLGSDKCLDKCPNILSGGDNPEENR